MTYCSVKSHTFHTIRKETYFIVLIHLKISSSYPRIDIYINKFSNKPTIKNKN